VGSRLIRFPHPRYAPHPPPALPETQHLARTGCPIHAAFLAERVGYFVCHSAAQRRNLLLPFFPGGSRGHKVALATELDGPLHFVFVLSRNCLDRCLYRWQSVLSFFPTPQPPHSAALQSRRLQPPSRRPPSAIAAEFVPSPLPPAFPC